MGNARIKALLADIGFVLNLPMLSGNNQEVIYIIDNSVFHKREKHIERDCHFIRDKVYDNLIHLIYVRSNNQLIDMLAKAYDFTLCKIHVPTITMPCLGCILAVSMLHLGIKTGCPWSA